ncbi:hypothetical protein ACKWTF_000800 [Chironomus riparius]
MDYNELKDRLDEIFTECIRGKEKVELEFEVFEKKLMKYQDYKVVHPKKKLKYNKTIKEPEIIPNILNKTYNIEEAVESKELIEPTQSYNPTPLSTKMHIKNIFKGSENSQAQVPVKKFKRKLDIKKLQDESSFFFNKVPPLLPLVITRKPITFDDLDTDDEQPKGQYPKWSFPRYYMRKMKEQVYVEWKLVEQFYSCPSLDAASVLSIFPSTSPSSACYSRMLLD